MWQNVSSGASSIADGAAVATGLRGGSDESFTVLVMGVDARPGSPIDIGVRPDVLMLVRFDPTTQSCRALSVPRDTRVELPGYGQSKINHALMVGGIPYQILVTEDFLDVEIDHYLLIDFVAFEQIVDSVGGITVDVPEDLTKNDQLHFTEGTQAFDGEEALAYARFRSGPEADRARIQRQWGVLSSIADEMEGRDLVSQVSQVTTTIDDHLRTDLPAADMTSIAKVYGGTCSSMGMESISMMAGTWVHFDDPILGRTEVYNFVEPAVVERHVDELLDGIPEETHDASPPAEGTASPEAVETTRNDDG
ncbi:MAG: LCP family protein [Chloroflexota bacterium]|nr:LCP family protein [Chloroflexota bacterium]